MDLNKIKDVEKANAGAWLTLTGPLSGGIVVDDAGKPCRIQLSGRDGDKFRRASREQAEAFVQKVSRTQQADEFANLKTLAKCFIAWEGFTRDGKAIDCTEEAAFELMQKAPWVAEQVDVFVCIRANFLKG